MQQKDKRADGTPRRLCLSHCLFNRVDYCGKGTGHFWSSGKQLWKTIWNKCMQLLVLYLRPNDYLNTVFDDVVSLFGSCSNNALAILPLRVISLTRKEYAISNRNISTWMVRRAFNAIFDRSKTEAKVFKHQNWRYRTL